MQQEAKEIMEEAKNATPDQPVEIMEPVPMIEEATEKADEAIDAVEDATSEATEEVQDTFEAAPETMAPEKAL